MAVLLNSQPAQERQAEPARTVNLMPTEERALTLMAANDVQDAFFYPVQVDAGEVIG